jgi:hypothetical protein
MLFLQVFLEASEHSYGSGWMRYEGETAAYAGDLEACRTRFEIRRNHVLRVAELVIEFLLMAPFKLPRDMVKYIAAMTLD